MNFGVIALMGARLGATVMDAGLGAGCDIRRG